MKNYSTPEIEIIKIEAVDVIATSSVENDVKEHLITWGDMSKNVNSGDIDLFR